MQCDYSGSQMITICYYREFQDEAVLFLNFILVNVCVHGVVVLYTIDIYQKKNVQDTEVVILVMLRLRLSLMAY